VARQQRVDGVAHTWSEKGLSAARVDLQVHILVTAGVEKRDVGTPFFVVAFLPVVLVAEMLDHGGQRVSLHTQRSPVELMEFLHVVRYDIHVVQAQLHERFLPESQWPDEVA
jgi:hypothetical protein